MTTRPMKTMTADQISRKMFEGCFNFNKAKDTERCAQDMFNASNAACYSQQLRGSYKLGAKQRYKEAAMLYQRAAEAYKLAGSTKADEMFASFKRCTACANR